MHMAILVGMGRFRACGMAFHKVGHTHNEVDQRFTLVRSALNRATVLQTPEDSELCLFIKISMGPLKVRVEGWVCVSVTFFAGGHEL